MALYTLESQKGYGGPKELELGTKFARVGVYLESLVLKTPLEPYRLRELQERNHIDRGFVVDGGIELGKNIVTITPQVLKPEIVQQLIARALLKNPTSQPLTIEDFRTLTIPHGHLRAQHGLKLLMPWEDEEYVCRLIPPVPDSSVHLSKRSAFD